MGSLFSSSSSSGGSSAAPGGRGGISQQDQAVLDLKRARDRLKKYQIKLTADCDHLQEQARALIRAGKRDRALMVLKMRKVKERHFEQTDAELLRLHELVDSIEWETQQLEVLEGLKAGNAALQKIHQEMPVEAVEQLMDETAEAQAYQEEINQLLGGELTEADEDELLAELDQINAGALAAALPEAPAAEGDVLAAQLPEAPSGVVGVAGVASASASAEAGEVEGEEERQPVAA